MNPIPTKYSKELLKMPSSLLSTSKTTRKPLRERLISNDQKDTFREKDNITSLADLNETTTPDGFQFKKSNDHALIYNLVFDQEKRKNSPIFQNQLRLLQIYMFNCLTKAHQYFYLNCARAYCSIEKSQHVRELTRSHSKCCI